MYFLLDLLHAVVAYTLGERIVLPAYLVGQTLKWALAFGFVVDLYGLVLAPQPALARFGRGMVAVLFVLSAATSVPSFFVELSRPYDPERLTFLFTRIERMADLTIANLLVLMGVFLV